MSVLIDARGLRCPWPAIRLARALRDGATDIELLADDPAAPRELAATAQLAGAILRPASIEAPHRFLIQKMAS